MPTAKEYFCVSITQNQRSKMSYKPFCFPPRDPQSGFSKLAIGLDESYQTRCPAWEPLSISYHRKHLERAHLMRLPCPCPVKQKRALLKSNPPRDNWIEGDEITVSIWGGQKTSPKQNLARGLFQSRACLENFDRQSGCSGAVSSKQPKTALRQSPFFRSKPIRLARLEWVKR